MLNYEEAFHFNDYYEKYQKSPLLKFCWIILESTVWYTAFFLLLRLGTDKFPDLYAWKHMNSWFTFGNITFIKADLIYYAAGLLIIYYAKKRHPMYGTFLFLYIGVLLSLRSLNGILLALLLIGFQYINAILEEGRILKTKLKIEYQQYKREVKGIFFNLEQRILIVIIFMVCLIGFIF